MLMSSCCLTDSGECGVRGREGDGVKASDVMSTKLVTVTADTPARSVAIVLWQNGISAVPVVDSAGIPLGIVSEGDLMPRNDAARDARRDWWLQMLSQGEPLSPDYLAFLASTDRTAGQIMVSPVVAVDEDADITAIAELLSERRIKRVPVLRDGRLVGIVSRADLVRAVAHQAPRHEPEPPRDEASPREPAPLLMASEQLQALTRRAATPRQPQAIDSEFSARAFQELAAQSAAAEAAGREAAKHHARDQRRAQADKMRAQHLTEDAWQHMLQNARAIARKGETEFQLIQFPCELCSDHGRAVNAPDPEWPTTLRGIAADIFLRWKSDLRAKGFGLNARVVSFPEGLPGEIGLFLSWGRKS
jgi:CBS domain-containing protein